MRIRTRRKAREPELRGEGDLGTAGWLTPAAGRVASSPKVGPRQDPGGSAQGACT